MISRLRYWEVLNSDQATVRKLVWTILDAEKNVERSRKWRALNPERYKTTNSICSKRYRREHPESKVVSEAKRRKYLGEISKYLNEWFRGSHLHHMGEGVGIFIPEALHLSVKHSLSRNRNMEEINSKALQWWREQV